MPLPGLAYAVGGFTDKFSNLLFHALAAQAEQKRQALHEQYQQNQQDFRENQQRRYYEQLLAHQEGRQDTQNAASADAQQQKAMRDAVEKRAVAYIHAGATVEAAHARASAELGAANIRANAPMTSLKAWAAENERRAKLGQPPLPQPMGGGRGVGGITPTSQAQMQQRVLSARLNLHKKALENSFGGDKFAADMVDALSPAMGAVAQGQQIGPEHYERVKKIFITHHPGMTDDEASVHAQSELGGMGHQPPAAPQTDPNATDSSTWPTWQE